MGPVSSKDQAAWAQEMKFSVTFLQDGKDLIEKEVDEIEMIASS